LHQLPRGLEAAYDKILYHISSQSGSQKDVAFAAFKIVMVSRRPLSPSELVAAVVQDPEIDFCIDEDVDIDYLLEVCHNLLVVADGSLEKPVDAERETLRVDYELMGGYQYQKIDNDENISRPIEETRFSTTVIGTSSICRFSHLSVQEYLENRHWSTQESETFVAGICLRTLLSFRLSDNPGDWDLRRRGIDTADEIDTGNQTILSVAEVEKPTKLRVIWDPDLHHGDEVTSSEQILDSNNDDRHETQAVKFQPPPFQCFVELVHLRTRDDGDSHENISFDSYIEGRRNTGLEGWAAYASQNFASHVRSVISAKEADPIISDLLLNFMGTPGKSSNSYRAWAVFNQNNYETTKRGPNTSPEGLDKFYSRSLLRPFSEPALGCAMLGLEQILLAWLEEASLDSILKSERGDSLLILAIEGEHAQVCDLLLKHGADPNMYDSREMSPLDIAVGKRNEQIVAALLKAGARPNFHSSKVDDYPLMRAVKLDDIRIARELLQHGADISLGYQKLSSASPLVHAVGQSNVDLVALLLEHVHNLPRWEYRGLIWCALEELSKAKHDSAAPMLKLLMPHATELKGLSTLHLAVLNGNWPLANALIELRLDVNMLDNNFNTPLLYIAHEDCKEKPKKLKQLINWGANVNATDIDGRTALHVCINRYSDRKDEVEDTREEVISLLLHHGADPNATDKKSTPLFVAACLDASVPVSVIRMLINAGADLNKAAGAERHFMTPLDAANFRIAPNDTAGNRPDEILENDNQESDNKESLAQKNNDQTQGDEQNQQSDSATNQKDKQQELLDILRQAGARYTDENKTADRRTAWKREV
jgi:ankyrin repeat protein